MNPRYREKKNETKLFQSIFINKTKRIGNGKYKHI